MRIADFIKGAPAGTEEVLQVLGTAESLTDEVAAKLYVLRPVHGLNVSDFLFALHQSNFVEPRNSEWSFPTSVLDELRSFRSADPTTIRQAHVELLAIGLEALPGTAGRTVPSYLLTDAGKAYHSAYAGRTGEALAYYGRLASGTIENFGGVQWLASRFVVEQQRASVLPSDSVDLLFLRAMTLYREGLRTEANALFQRIVEKDEVSKFTAIACDIVGVGLRRTDRVLAERLFRRAVEISREIGDRTGEGVHLHNLAQVLRGRGSEPEKAFRASLAIAEEQGDDYSAAIRKNGLADLLAHTGRRHHLESEQLLTEAIRFFEEAGDEAGIGPPTTTLARLVAMDPSRVSEAADLYRRAIAIAREHRDRTGLSIRLSGLAKLLKEDPERVAEALALLEENLSLAQSANDRKLERSIIALLEVLRRPAG